MSNTPNEQPNSDRRAELRTKLRTGLLLLVPFPAALAVSPLFRSYQGLATMAILTVVAAVAFLVGLTVCVSAYREGKTADNGTTPVPVMVVASRALRALGVAGLIGAAVTAVWPTEKELQGVGAILVGIPSLLVLLVGLALRSRAALRSQGN